MRETFQNSLSVENIVAVASFSWSFLKLVIKEFYWLQSIC